MQQFRLQRSGQVPKADDLFEQIFLVHLYTLFCQVAKHSFFKKIKLKRADFLFSCAPQIKSLADAFRVLQIHYMELLVLGFRRKNGLLPEQIICNIEKVEKLKLNVIN